MATFDRERLHGAHRLVIRYIQQQAFRHETMLSVGLPVWVGEMMIEETPTVVHHLTLL